MNFMKVFDYYKSLGVLEYSEITLPGSLPNDLVLTNLWMYDPDDPYNNKHDPHNQIWRNEEISVNDCYLKNANKYKYIINKDMDEMIVPLKENNYHEMMEMIEETTRDKVSIVCFIISFSLFQSHVSRVWDAGASGTLSSLTQCSPMNPRPSPVTCT